LSYSDFERPIKSQYRKYNQCISRKQLYSINENDTVATDEIRFGDNDKLAALAAVLSKVDILIIATNTNGIYTNRQSMIKLPETITL
jgi:glutamate 5-kinase